SMTSKSTSVLTYAWAEVSSDRTMCSAVILRILLSGTDDSEPTAAVAAALTRGAGGGGDEADAAGRTGASEEPPAERRWSSTSLRVMRPPTPVPLTSDGSTPASSSSRLTTGDS